MKSKSTADNEDKMNLRFDSNGKDCIDSDELNFLVFLTHLKLRDTGSNWKSAGMVTGKTVH